jgi:hypothetical protein
MDTGTENAAHACVFISLFKNVFSAVLIIISAAR